MADELINFDELEKEALVEKKQEEVRVKEQEEKDSKPFAKWTKGPLIVGGILAVVIVAGMLLFAYL